MSACCKQILQSSKNFSTVTVHSAIFILRARSGRGDEQTEKREGTSREKLVRKVVNYCDDLKFVTDVVITIKYTNCA